MRHLEKYLQNVSDFQKLLGWRMCYQLSHSVLRVYNVQKVLKEPSGLGESTQGATREQYSESIQVQREYSGSKSVTPLS
jgi:hypothetical protein